MTMTNRNLRKKNGNLFVRQETYYNANAHLSTTTTAHYPHEIRSWFAIYLIVIGYFAGLRLLIQCILDLVQMRFLYSQMCPIHLLNHYICLLPRTDTMNIACLSFCLSD